MEKSEEININFFKVFIILMLMAIFLLLISSHIKIFREDKYVAKVYEMGKCELDEQLSCEQERVITLPYNLVNYTCTSNVKLLDYHNYYFSHIRVLNTLDLILTGEEDGMCVLIVKEEVKNIRWVW